MEGLRSPSLCEFFGDFFCKQTLELRNVWHFDLGFLEGMDHVFPPISSKSRRKYNT